MSYPKNLTYLAKKLSGYSRQTYKLQTTNQTTATAGQIVTVDLPSNALVDLSTLTWFFRGRTTTSSGNAAFPRNIECIIERLEVEINGQLVGQGCQFYNHLWEIISDTTMGEDVVNRRRILQNGANNIGPGSTADATSKQYAIQNWLGFLGSAKPNVLDTSLLGNVRIRITLSSPAVLVKQLATAGESYLLEDMFFSVDTISIDDGIFYNIHNQFLQSGGVYEIPFNNFLSFSSSAAGSCKFSLSTQSLDRVWATIVPGSSLPMGGDHVSSVISNSPYFHRIGNAGNITWGGPTNNRVVSYGLTSWQFNINNQYYPNYRPTAEQAYALMINSYGLSQDTLGGGHPLLSSLSAWNNGFWVASENFNHNSDDFISGIDTRGNVVQAYFEYDFTVTPGATGGTGFSGALDARDKLTCLVFAQTTSTLRVGAGKSIDMQM